MSESRGYQWFIFLFTTAIVVICIINIINYNQIKSNFDAYKVTLAFTADPIGNPSIPIPPTNIGVGKAYVNGDLVSVTNASLTGFQRGSFNVTIATYDINTGIATFTNAVNVDGTTFGASTYNISPTANPDGMSEGAILTAKWINIILLILALAVWLWRVYLFFFPPSSVAVVSEYFGENFEAGTGYANKAAKALGRGIKKLFTREDAESIARDAVNLTTGDPTAAAQAQNQTGVLIQAGLPAPNAVTTAVLNTTQNPNTAAAAGITTAVNSGQPTEGVVTALRNAGFPRAEANDTVNNAVSSIPPAPIIAQPEAPTVRPPNPLVAALMANQLFQNRINVAANE